MAYSDYFAKWAGKKLSWLYPEHIQIPKQANATIPENVEEEFFEIGYNTGIADKVSI